MLGPAERRMPIPKLSMGTDEIQGLFGDCVLHEQIVILLPACKVLSKEERCRLKD